MSKLHFKTRKEGIAYLQKLGIDGTGFSSMHQMAVTAEQAEKRATAKTAPVAAPVAATPKADSIESLKAAAKAERNPSLKVDKYSELSARLEADLKAQSNPFSPEATNLRRELTSAQKAYGYSRLAEDAASPDAGRIRKLI